MCVLMQLKWQFHRLCQEVMCVLMQLKGQFHRLCQKARCVLMQLKWQFHILPGSNVCSDAIEMAIS